MQIEIELVGKADRWSYQQQRIRIGRDPGCDLSLPGNEYPMISREHLVLEVSGASLSLTDTRSSNGTYLNGSRVTTAAVASGDTVRLGAEGPQLRIYFKDVRATMLESPAVSPGGTMFERSPMAAPGGEQQGSDRPSRVSFGSAPQPESNPEAALSAVPNNSIPEAEPGADIVIERKLNQIRNLLALNLIGLLSVLFAMFYQGQQIAKNKDAVADLKKGAESAVQQFTPALDARLSTFEKRMDGMDAKMKEAEDRFVERLNRQIPVALDAYVNRKMQEVKRQADKYQR